MTLRTAPRALVGASSPATSGGSAANRPAILYLSSVPARDETSGALVMHRHLSAAASRFAVHCAHDVALPQPAPDIHVLPRRALFDRLSNTRYSSVVHGLNAATGLAVASSAIDAVVRQVQPRLILTVGEGSLHIAARRAAWRHGVPLVAIFHDWSPTWLPGSPAVRRLAERQFRRLYRASDVALVVSPALGAALGPHRDCRVLPPIPGEARSTPRASAGQPFFALYAGTFQHLYRGEVRALCEAFRSAEAASLLRLHGPAPGWPAEEAAVLDGIYRGFLPRAGLEEALASAGALLVAIPFAWDEIATLSFPSKLTEYCRFRKPIVVWAPPHAAAAQWATTSGAAMLVSSPDPAAVVAAVCELREKPALAQTLADAAGRWADDAFHPARLQAEFEDALHTALARKESHP